MPQFSGPFRVMQRPELKTDAEVNDDGARAGRRVARRKKKIGRKEGGMRGEPEVLFIKPGRTNDRRENRGGKNG